MVDAGRYSIVDWDELKYAPPERDAWVMCCRERPKRQWAQDMIEETMRPAGVPYELRLERLAYYTYYQYFFYLAGCLQAYSHRHWRSGKARVLLGWRRHLGRRLDH